MGQYSFSIGMGRFTQIAILLALFSLATADLVRQGRRGGRRLGGRRRQGRQDLAEAPAEIPGGVNFDGCVDDEETITTIQKDPILECTHKNVEKCHYTYVTQ